MGLLGLTGVAWAEAPTLNRADFNRLAVQANLPIIWTQDANQSGALDPADLTVLSPAPRSRYVRKDRFTKDFDRAYRSLVERRRQEAVAKELDQGRITVMETNIAALSDEDGAVMRHLETVATLIDELYAVQTGDFDLTQYVPKDDTASQALFRRNNSPTCSASATASDPFCNATPDFRRPRSAAYPKGVTLDQAFCDRLSKEPNAKALLDPFTVVRRKGKGFIALPYTDVYGRRMKAIAKSLRAAADTIESPQEAAFKAYLLASANGFETNQWWDADEAWAAMDSDNSAWYLRVGPDETYFDPCQVKAGFHLSLARVDRSAVAWKKRLTALRSDMEKAIAKMIGAPYEARPVQFALPEFIEIVLNAGDSRSLIGGTAGQSLPNFGPVAQTSRGRTVAMGNLGSDPDSMAVLMIRNTSLFSTESMASYDPTPTASHLDIVLHEATHNFGPTSAWRVDDKRPPAIFGGPTAAILEELKAQTGSFVLLDFLRQHGHLTDKQYQQGCMSSVAWAFSHIARGLVTASGQPRVYSQLAAIHVHALMEVGALRFVDEGEGADKGRFTLDFAKIPAVMSQMMHDVGNIKARGDRAAAETLIKRGTDTAAQATIHADIITERVRRHPKMSLVYKIRYR